MHMIGSEQIHNPTYSSLEKIYIAIFGMPIVGLRIRARNVFGLIPAERTYAQILDAGSGPGVFSFELARRFPGAQVTGIDPLPEPIAACRQIAEKIRSTNVDFQEVAIENLSVSNCYDLILCVDILEHITDDQNALQHLYAVTAPAGILVLHVPALYRRYPVLRKSLNFDVVSHVRTGYEPAEIRRKVERAGFKIRSSGFTYGIVETLANNISYMITRARMENKSLYALAFPFLNLMSWIGKGARPNKLGAGIYVVAEKANDKH